MLFQRLGMAIGLRPIHFLSKCGAALCSIIIIMMVLSTMVDTFCRYCFNMPISGVIESNEVLFPVLVFFGLAYTQFKKGHIRVTFLLDHLGSVGKRRLEVLSLLLSALVAGAMGYRTWIAAMYSYGIQEEYWAVISNWTLYVWPAKIAVSVGLWMLVLQCLADLIETIRATGDEHSGDKENAHV